MWISIHGKYLSIFCAPMSTVKIKEVTTLSTITRIDGKAGEIVDVIMDIELMYMFKQLNAYENLPLCTYPLVDRTNTRYVLS